MGMKRSTEGASPDRNESSAWLALKALVGAGVFFGGLTAVYMGGAWLLGIYPHPDLGVWTYVSGVVATFLISGVISLVGESLIEDIVKFVLIGGTGIGILIEGTLSPTLLALVLALPLGTGLPLVMRVIARFQNSEI